MSRIGKLPIEIPAGVTVAVTDQNLVTVKGPKGELSKQFHKEMIITVEDNSVVVNKPSENKLHRALQGTLRAIINNMVIGVTEGFKKVLELVGVGYRAEVKGGNLVMNLGYSHPVEITAVEGVTFKTEGTTKVIVEGIDKEKVGSAAADIRKWRVPEPYKGKGIKYEGEYIRRKEGKTGK
ncbi:50S ribosomal protein L6 [Oceanirhabdus seepicola]|uniref:Large ribosomal subunit protein uL6 n=1 Tax=Oceanirhabdus seepicola TaxID=2828781 RepID=A0A9J6NZY6_9CLOT|nr:50S ribosomal protein L6 [Oceanirhabdus seepicola]MCM1989660.1 50S ribosomal protein L6 [Oceanirhabdus seepicola]